MIGMVKGTMRETKSVAGLPSPIASFRTNASGLVLPTLKTTIEAVQSGSGDPSPSNPRPISGWTEANLSRVGKNVWGGLTMADDCVNAVNYPIYCEKGTDEVGDYVSLVASYAIGVPFFSTFKANTRYTIRLKVSKEGNPANKTTNMEILYTDGTSTFLNAPTNFSVNNVQEYVIVSSANKTIECIRGNYYSGTARFYYDDCGVMEGVHTLTDFEPYNGMTVTLQFGTTIYGGSIDWVSGVVTLTWEKKKLSDFSWNRNAQYNIYYAYIDNKAKGYTNIICDTYKTVSKYYPLMSDGEISGTDLNNGINIKDDAFSDPTTFIQNRGNVEICYKLATPTTIQLTPQQIEQLRGENNVFVDCGEVSELKYQNRIVTKLFSKG